MTGWPVRRRELIHDLAEIGGDAHRAVVLNEHEGEAHRERDPMPAHEGQQGSQIRDAAIAFAAGFFGHPREDRDIRCLKQAGHAPLEHGRCMVFNGPMLFRLNPPVRALILDMDGVLWAGNEALIDMPAAFRKMKDLDLKVMLATNNATRTAAQFVEKVRSFGVEVGPDQIINSPMAVADILEQRFPGGGPVYIFGEEGVRTTLREHGYYHAEKNVLAVIIGLNREATFADFCAATSLIRGGAPFIGTNPDKTFPQPNGTVIPGGGAFVAFFEASTGVKPVIAGKPFPFLFNLAIKRLGIPPQQTLAVGDRLDIDIIGGGGRLPHRVGAFRCVPDHGPGILLSTA